MQGTKGEIIRCLWPNTNFKETHHECRKHTN